MWIDDVQVFPNVEKKSALVKIKIGNATGQAGSGNVAAVFRGMDSINVPASVNIKWDSLGGTAEMEVPLPEPKLWDEFHPSLQFFNLQLFSASGGIR